MPKSKPKSNKFKYIIFVLFGIFVAVSFIAKYKPGMQIAENFSTFGFDLIKMLPFIFILIGLFDVWIKKETVEKHLGEGGSLVGYLWVILLAGTTVGGLYMAFPVAAALRKKGARISIIFVYLSAASSARVTMSFFEASFVGVKFTFIRLLITVPLILLFAEALRKWDKKENSLETNKTTP